MAHSSFRKCVVNIKYLGNYTENKKKKAAHVEEDLEDGELSDPDEEATT